jgi:hypothetical protein
LGAVAALVACSTEEPCRWETTTTARDATIATAPGVSLVCNGAEEPPPELGLFYEHDAPGTLRLRVIAARVMVEISFEGSLPDGTYPVDGARVRAFSVGSNASSSGVLTFRRSRDVPFVDIKEPESRTYTSTISVTLELTVTAAGCTLTTGKQEVTLVQSGPIQSCTRGYGGHG